MPNLLKHIRNRKSKNAAKAIDTNTDIEVVRDLTVLSSTSKSSPSNSSSGSICSAATQPRRKQVGKNSAQIFRRVTSAHNLLTRRSSSCGEDEGSHGSSLTASVYNENPGIEKLDTPTANILATPLRSQQSPYQEDFAVAKNENHVPSAKSTCEANEAALSLAKTEIGAKDAKIRYLTVLVKELKSLYTKRLVTKDAELIALRSKLEKTVEELAITKQNLTQAIEGHARLLEDFTKKAREDHCWFSPVLGSIQFN
ncbi:hypothetical protein IV203_009300 [Nitzschia inconspicua]|uniref:Uncharacterized protein n=1 Tax=Nitzschia inconspicua TaxID=303405 RepID=A0A9K3L1X2_9STRA|nr:hypothetical protein IV203_009300 [Nitzschia inconspicua]